MSQSADSATTASLDGQSAGGALLSRLRAVALRRRALLGTVAASFFVFALQAVQGMLLARVLGPEGRGQYNTALFYTHLLMFAGMLGIPFVIQRRAASSSSASKGSLRGLSMASIGAALITGLASVVVVGLLSYFTLPSEKQSLVPLCLLAAISLPLLHVRLALQAVDRGSENFLRHNVSDVFFWAVLPMMLCYLWWSGSGDVEWVVGLSVTAALAAAAFRLALGRLADFTWPPDPRPRTLLREGMPYALAKGVSDVLNRLDGLLVLLLATFTVQGYYAAAVPAAGMLSVAPAALAMFAFNTGAKGPARISGRRLAMASGLSVAMQVVSAVVLALLLPTLMLLVFGEEFAGAIPFALALVPAKAVAGVGQIAEGYLRGRNKPHIEFRARLAGGAILLTTAVVAWPWLHEFSIPLAALAGHAFPTVVMGAAILWDARGGHATPKSGHSASGV